MTDDDEAGNPKYRAAAEAREFLAGRGLMLGGCEPGTSSDAGPSHRQVMAEAKTLRDELHHQTMAALARLYPPGPVLTSEEQKAADKRAYEQRRDGHRRYRAAARAEMEARHRREAHRQRVREWLEAAKPADRELP
jgi:hypothetical protein